MKPTRLPHCAQLDDAAAASRRRVLLGGASAALLLALSRQAQAQSARPSAAPASAPDPWDGDFKALVCVFLQGGNDGNNTIVPLGDAPYAAYAAARGGLALPRQDLVPLSVDGNPAGIGVHPALAPLAPAWAQRRMAWVLNVGALVEPLDRAAWRGGGARPDNLFSHADQQEFAQALMGAAGLDGRGTAPPTGWGHRLASQLGAAGPGSRLPALISLAGNVPFVQGSAPRALALPSRGTFGVGGGNGAAATARAQAYRAIWSQTSSATASPIGREAADVVASALASAPVVNALLATPPAGGPDVERAFAGLTSDIAQQLLRVACLLRARAAIGNRRQVYFVALNGFDTHTAQLREQARLLGDLAAAMAAFDQAVGVLGIDRQVTTFTLSDFARTLRPNNSGGSDHGWGNHAWVMGGAVRGGQVVGTFPSMVPDGADDAGADGRWIPTLAHDQLAATLALWFGAAPGELASIAPHIGRFARADLGFMA